MDELEMNVMIDMLDEMSVPWDLDLVLGHNGAHK